MVIKWLKQGCIWVQGLEVHLSALDFSNVASFLSQLYPCSSKMASSTSWPTAYPLTIKPGWKIAFSPNRFFFFFNAQDMMTLVRIKSPSHLRTGHMARDVRWA